MKDKRNKLKQIFIQEIQLFKIDIANKMLKSTMSKVMKPKHWSMIRNKHVLIKVHCILLWSKGLILPPPAMLL